MRMNLCHGAARGDWRWSQILSREGVSDNLGHGGKICWESVPQQPPLVLKRGPYHCVLRQGTCNLWPDQHVRGWKDDEWSWWPILRNRQSRQSTLQEPALQRRDTFRNTNIFPKADYWRNRWPTQGRRLWINVHGIRCQKGCRCGGSGPLWHEAPACTSSRRNSE